MYRHTYMSQVNQDGLPSAVLSYDVQADFPPFINDCVWRRKAKSWATTLTT